VLSLSERVAAGGYRASLPTLICAELARSAAEGAAGTDGPGHVSAGDGAARAL